MILSEAEAKLLLWESALDAISQGQEYTVGKTTLTRVDVDKCLKMVQYYQGEVLRLTAGRGRGARVFRVIPRDF